MKKYLLRWSNLGPFTQTLVSSGILILIGAIAIWVNESIMRPAPLE